jgi:hypothetical protein
MTIRFAPVALAALLSSSLAASALAQATGEQAEQFTPEFRAVHTGVDRSTLRRSKRRTR